MYLTTLMISLCFFEQELPNTFYKRFYPHLQNHHNLLVTELFSPYYSWLPVRNLKRKLCYDYLNKPTFDVKAFLIT